MAAEADRRTLALLFAAVAEERDGIASEPPLDIDRLAARWVLDEALVAVADWRCRRLLHVDPGPFGSGDLGMLVAGDWRGRGVGSALVAAAIDWAREHGLRKLALSVFPAQRGRDRALPQVRARGGGPAREAHPPLERRALDIVDMGLLL